jgi:hypothetical protein
LVRERYSAGLTKGWPNAFTGCHPDTLQICHSLPQEDTKLTNAMKHLEAHIEHLGAHIEDMKSIVTGKFAFNLDEVGSSD